MLAQVFYLIIKPRVPTHLRPEHFRRIVKMFDSAKSALVWLETIAESVQLQFKIGNFDGRTNPVLVIYERLLLDVLFLHKNLVDSEF